jgi:hypothetical protein
LGRTQSSRSKPQRYAKEILINFKLNRYPEAGKANWVVAAYHLPLLHDYVITHNPVAMGSRKVFVYHLKTLLTFATVLDYRPLRHQFFFVTRLNRLIHPATSRSFLIQPPVTFKVRNSGVSSEGPSFITSASSKGDILNYLSAADLQTSRSASMPRFGFEW